MIRFFLLLLFFTVNATSQTIDPTLPTIELLELKAFPTAHGLGRYTTGGRSGDVYKVTNLNSSGAGSFKDGYLSTTGARTIVFEVSGNIDYGSTMFLNSNPNITIAGQTSPNGVALYSSTGGIEQRVGNTIWRHIKFRGTTTDRSNLRLNAVSNNISDVIVDHCSFSWAGTNEMNIDMTGQGSYKVQDMTAQYNIMGGVTRNILMYTGTNNVSIFRNLLTQSQMRGIRKNYPNTDITDTFHFEEINNILHGFQEPPIGVSLGSKFSVINNLRTPSSEVTVNGAINPSIVRGESDGTGTAANTYAYIDGNSNEVPTGLEQVNLDSYLESTAYLSSDYIGDHILNANELETYLPAYLGSFWYDGKRDSQDVLYLSNFENRTGDLAYTGTLPTISDVTPPIDTDDDGMIDVFEDLHGLDKNDVSDKNAVKEDWDFGDYTVKNTAGYTNLEMYLNWKAGDFQMMLDGIEKPDDSWRFLSDPETIPTIRPWQLKLNGKSVRMQLGDKKIN